MRRIRDRGLPARRSEERPVLQWWVRGKRFEERNPTLAQVEANTVARSWVNEGIDFSTDRLIGGASAVGNEYLRPDGDRGTSLLPDALNGVVTGAQGPRFLQHQGQGAD